MDFASVHNFYEQLVLDKLAILSRTELSEESEDLLCDMACVALNQLPARYVRHNVDMLFYMPVEERQQIDIDVDKAVKQAIKYVRKHKKK